MDVTDILMANGVFQVLIQLVREEFILFQTETPSGIYQEMYRNMSIDQITQVLLLHKCEMEIFVQQVDIGIPTEIQQPLVKQAMAHQQCILSEGLI